MTHTLKVVVLGDAGVGKTALRAQYVSGRFAGTSGYRATVGADFVAKTLDDDGSGRERVVLQIWDTAGQERFSSLSSALFRGADAALLLFDVARPESLHALARWWTQLRACCAHDVVVAVVGTKIDLTLSDGETVSHADARAFIDTLVPPLPSRMKTKVKAKAGAGNTVVDSIAIAHRHRRSRSKSLHPHPDSSAFNTLSSVRSSQTAFFTPSSSVFSNMHANESRSPSTQRRRRKSKSVGRLSSLLLTPGATATATVSGIVNDSPMAPGSAFSSVRTTQTTFYTPSSSLFSSTGFASARTSPARSRSRSRSRSRFRSPSRSRSRSTSRYRHRRTHSSLSAPFSASPPPASASAPESPQRSPSPSAVSLRHRASLASMSTATSSAPTITPSLFFRMHGHSTDGDATTPPTPPLLDVHDLDGDDGGDEDGEDDGRPRLFFTSAKTGDGVADVFEHVARRVVQLRERERDEEDARGWTRGRDGRVRDRHGVVVLRDDDGDDEDAERGRGRWRGRSGACCAV